jgi:hypothetical protein
VTCPSHHTLSACQSVTLLFAAADSGYGTTPHHPRTAPMKQPITQQRCPATLLITLIDFRYFEIFARSLFVCFIYKIRK